MQEDLEREKQKNSFQIKSKHTYQISIISFVFSAFIKEKTNIRATLISRRIRLPRNFNS